MKCLSTCLKTFCCFSKENTKTKTSPNKVQNKKIVRASSEIFSRNNNHNDPSTSVVINVGSANTQPLYNPSIYSQQRYFNFLDYIIFMKKRWIRKLPSFQKTTLPIEFSTNIGHLGIVADKKKLTAILDCLVENAMCYAISKMLISFTDSKLDIVGKTHLEMMIKFDVETEVEDFEINSIKKEINHFNGNIDKYFEEETNEMFLIFSAIFIKVNNTLKISSYT